MRATDQAASDKMSHQCNDMRGFDGCYPATVRLRPRWEKSVNLTSSLASRGSGITATSVAPAPFLMLCLCCIKKRLGHDRAPAPSNAQHERPGFASPIVSC